MTEADIWQVGGVEHWTEVSMIWRLPCMRYATWLPCSVASPLATCTTPRPPTNHTPRPLPIPLFPCPGADRRDAGAQLHPRRQEDRAPRPHARQHRSGPGRRGAEAHQGAGAREVLSGKGAEGLTHTKVRARGRTHYVPYKRTTTTTTFSHYEDLVFSPPSSIDFLE